MTERPIRIHTTNRELPAKTPGRPHLQDQKDSRVPDPDLHSNQRIQVFKLKKFLSELWSGKFLRYPDPDFLPIPDPGVKNVGQKVSDPGVKKVSDTGVKKVSDPGTGSTTLVGPYTEWLNVSNRIHTTNREPRVGLTSSDKFSSLSGGFWLLASALSSSSLAFQRFFRLAISRSQLKSWSSTSFSWASSASDSSLLLPNLIKKGTFSRFNT